jgi:hypothetical protein
MEKKREILRLRIPPEIEEAISGRKSGGMLRSE